MPFDSRRFQRLQGHPACSMGDSGHGSVGHAQSANLVGNEANDNL